MVENNLKIPRRSRPVGKNYKWTALSNTTLGVLMGAMNSSIVLISLPAIFRGLDVNPLESSESSYLLWMLMGYMVVTATLLVTIGRLSDLWGRVRLYNLGFLIFTVSSILLFLTPSSGNTGALEMIIFRLIQGIGGGCLIANSAAILTDAFPTNERGFALGLNMVAALAGSLIGLLLGGVLASVWWRAVFLVSVPFGIIGTIWAYLSLREQSTSRGLHKLDVLGNLCLGGGLTIFLVAITYGLTPYGGASTGWGNPLVIAGLVGGIVLLALFVVVESRSSDPLFHLELFKIRAFAMGCAAQFLSAMAYGGLQFVIIIWLQGVWLPLHGYNYEDTPLWSAIYLLPMLIGFMISGVLGGWLSDRIGVRGLATAGMIGLALGFILLTFFPADFDYPAFAIVLFVVGASFGIFAAPNSAAVMNSLPRQYRGVGSGMRSTFQNAGSPLSLGIFFSIMVVVLSNSLPGAIQNGLIGGGVPVQAATQASHIPPTGALFAAFLGYNPMESLLSPAVVSQLNPAAQANLLGTHFFPSIIASPFMDSLRVVFWFSAFLSVLGAVCSWLRGSKRFVYEESETTAVNSALSAEKTPAALEFNKTEQAS
jgi:EmrB/QacA subfamily drug resistance transporter